MTGRQYGSKTPIDIGSRLELMVDDHLIARVSGGAALRLNRPIPREVVLVTDRPWEGNACSYFTVFQDGELYRMYYYGLQFVVTKTANVEPHPWVFCYAESNDGVRWIRPELGLVEFNGSRKNNIILDSQAGIPTFAPFKDANPNAAPDAQYKAWIVRLGLDRRGLYPLKSPDGIHWTAMSDGPVITHGLFDSHNLAFWDTVRGEYRDYHRSEFRIRKTGEEPYSAHRVKRADGGGFGGRAMAATSSRPLPRISSTGRSRGLSITRRAGRTNFTPMGSYLNGTYLSSFLCVIYAQATEYTWKDGWWDDRLDATKHPTIIRSHQPSCKLQKKVQTINNSALPIMSAQRVATAFSTC